jgi:hypothetical protein
MLYHCFLDDSKDRHQQRLFISAGFYGDKDTWHEVRRAWRKCLRKYGIEYFKTSEYKMLRGQFEQFRRHPSPQGRDRAGIVRAELLGVLRRHPSIHGVGVTLPVEDFNRVCARPDATLMQGLPYQRALEGVLFETVKLVRNKPGNNTVAFVHDDGDDFDALRHVYNEFKKANPKTAQSIAGFQALSDKEHPPLQLADMVANLTLEIGEQWLANRRPLRSVKHMQENIEKLGVWDEHYMLSVLKRNLIRFGKAVPVDLEAEEYG